MVKATQRSSNKQKTMSNTFLSTVKNTTRVIALLTVLSKSCGHEIIIHISG